MTPKVFVVFGKPGAGKGTRIARVLEKRSDIYHISTGNLLRGANIDTSKGDLIDDKTVMSLVKKEIFTTELPIVI